MDPLANSPWSAPGTVTGFAQSAPNGVLMRVAQAMLGESDRRRALDIGCGAARNAVPLAMLGWDVLGVDLSSAMLQAAAGRRGEAGRRGRLQFALAPMDRLPVADASMDFVVAHGIWNLASSSAEFRRGVREAARVARPGAALFVFTFSRNTLAPDAQPVPGEAFVFTQFSGQPQCFLTATELRDELAAAGFVQEPGQSLTEYNVGRGLKTAPPQTLKTAPAIYEGVFRLR